MVSAKVTPFSDKSCYAYESLCDLCPRRFRWYYSSQCPFLGSDLFQQSSLKVKAFGKVRRIKKFEHHVLIHAGQNLFLCVGLLAENYVLDRM